MLSCLEKESLSVELLSADRGLKEGFDAKGLDPVALLEFTKLMSMYGQSADDNLRKVIEAIKKDPEVGERLGVEKKSASVRMAKRV